MKVTYSIDGALIDVLRVVVEVKATTGMVPNEIYTEDGQRLRYSSKDYHLLENNIINEEKYLENNK